MNTRVLRWATRACLWLAGAGTALSVQAQPKDVVVGFATAKTGWMEAYDTPATRAALIRIDEINAAGGLMGRKIKTLFADTKTDRAQAAKAGLQLLEQGADMLVVSCDYDFGAPAALAAEKAGKVSMFLCAEDAKAGIQGVGKRSFSGSIIAAVQGATMAEWAVQRRNVRSAYVLLDTMIEYNKSICKGFDWMAGSLKSLEVVGRDTFKNDDASIASQITRIKALPKEPDAIMLCSYAPGGASAVRQIRAAGIQSLIFNGSAMDGTYWLSAMPNLSNFVVPVQGSIYGDDPNPQVEAFNKAFERKFGERPSSMYAYPGYILLDLWAKAVERARSTEGDAVVAQLNRMNKEPTLFGPRTFTDKLHIQDSVPLLISEIRNGKPGIADKWTISTPVPLDVALKK